VHADRPIGVEVLVLAGGLGTRLSHVMADCPKILAPIEGRPFLDYLLHWLGEQGATRVVLGLGHRAAPVLEHLDARPISSLEVITVVEPEPLGTAGAIGFALSRLAGDPVLVMNGDTFVQADLRKFVASHRESKASASILCVRVEDAGRFGRIEIHDGRVRRFEEKSSAVSGPSWVSAGVYLLSRPLLERIAKLGKGSLEHDVLEPMPAGSIHAFQSSGPFLDIGTPESLAAASAFLAEAFA
jgi:NDP-sugar pyrophosphorylase family protein